MTIENLLRRYPTYKAELNITKLTLKGIELEIIDGSPAPSGGMPRGTDTSNLPGESPEIWGSGSSRARGRWKIGFDWQAKSRASTSYWCRSTSKLKLEV